MIAPKSFRLERSAGDGGVVEIVLSRPDKLNALTFEVYAELRDTLRALNADTSARAVILTGEGRGFCSGGDVDEIIGQLVRYDGPALLDFTRMTGDLIAAIRGLRKPVVAAVNGTAAGAGAVIALAADLRVFAESAKIAFLFPRVGLCGADMGAGWLLPRVVGLGRATEILLTGDAITAEESLRIGLANRVVPGEQVLPAARELAARLARGPTFAHAMTKVMLDAEATLSLPQALEAEAQAQQICMQTHDFREAFAAFAERRLPRFEGR
jgi:enoyl-CoA hydratase/carnithine racemase